VKINKIGGFPAATASLLRAATRSADDNFPTDATESPSACMGYRADLKEQVEEVARYTRCID
jgi:hypothetical protein